MIIIQENTMSELSLHKNECERTPESIVIAPSHRTHSPLSPPLNKTNTLQYIVTDHQYYNSQTKKGESPFNRRHSNKYAQTPHRETGKRFAWNPYTNSIQFATSSNPILVPPHHCPSAMRILPHSLNTARGQPVAADNKCNRPHPSSPHIHRGH